MKKTRKIAIASPVGGSGKTTTAVNLALSLAIEEKKTLIIDTTEQGSVGQVAVYLGYDEKMVPFSLADFAFKLSTSGINQETIYQVRDNLQLLRGGYSSRNLKLGFQKLRKERYTKDKDEISVYKSFFELFENIEDQFDFIIFDTNSHWGVFTISTLTYVDEVIISVNLEYNNYRSLLDYILINLDEVQRMRSDPLKLSKILPVNLDTRTECTSTRLYGLKDLFYETILNRKEAIGKYEDTEICKPLPYDPKLNKCYDSEPDMFWYLDDRRIVKEYREFTRNLMNKNKSQVAQAKKLAYA